MGASRLELPRQFIGRGTRRGARRRSFRRPRKGGMASNRSCLAHRTPIPVGPSILWALRPRKSQPSALTSVGRWGTDWAPSASTSAPGAVGGLGDAGKGGNRPQDVRHRWCRRRASPRRAGDRGSVSPAGSRRHGDPAELDAALLSQHQPWKPGWRGAPCRSAGTESPGERLARPHVAATRFTASVAVLP